MSKLQLNDGGFLPAISFGTGTSYRNRPDDVSDGVYMAIKAGYRAIDTAIAYKNEASVGTALQRAINEGICSREDIFIITKIPAIVNTQNEGRKII